MRCDSGNDKIDCLNCFVSGTFQLNGHVAVKGGKLTALNLVALPQDVSATLEMRATLSTKKKNRPTQREIPRPGRPRPRSGHRGGRDLQAGRNGGVRSGHQLVLHRHGRIRLWPPRRPARNGEGGGRRRHSGEFGRHGLRGLLVAAEFRPPCLDGGGQRERQHGAETGIRHRRRQRRPRRGCRVDEAAGDCGQTDGPVQ